MVDLSQLVVKSIQLKKPFWECDCRSDRKWLRGAASVAIMGVIKFLSVQQRRSWIHKGTFTDTHLAIVMTVDKASNALKSSGSIINAYVAKTGLSEEEILDMMRNETYMSA